MRSGIIHAARPRWWTLPVWALILIGLPALLAWVSGWRIGPLPAEGVAVRRAASPPVERETPPPPVEPMKVLELAPETAREINAAVPFSTAPNPAARPFRFNGDPAARARAVDCLAAAQLYEAGDDPTGQKAVAQVVINRLRHPAFPKTICGVVFQGAERATGCQFTFTCDGSLARRPLADGWRRAQGVASLALGGYVFSPAGWATHYHADYVVPNWAYTLAKVTQLGTHIFYRWPGRRGSPVAFTQKYAGLEPEMSQILASIATLPAQAQQPAAHIPVAERPIIANSPNQATAGAPIAPVSPERWILEGPSRTSSPAATPDKAPLSAEPKPTKVARASP